MKVSIGTSLIHIMDYIENTPLASKYKARILDYCKTELEIGDGKVSNEIEVSMLQAWLNGCDEISMPMLENNCTLLDTYSFKEGEYIKVFEEYQSIDNTYYIKTITKDINGNVIKTQLTHRTASLKDMLTNSGVEDILIDIQGNNIADSRLIQKTAINELGIKKINLYTDINIDGKLD